MRMQWGTVFPRKNREGKVSSWVARYTSPLDHSKKISKSFPIGQKALAYQWLEEEHALVDRAEMGLAQWTPPSERIEREHGPTFEEYANQWIREYRLVDGRRAEGATRRNLEADVSHLIRAFGGMEIGKIRRKDLRDWYDAEHPEGPHSFHRQCARMKRILKAAEDGSVGEWGKLIQKSPWSFRLPPLPESGREDVEPVTPVELKKLYHAMPCYDRLIVYIAAVVGGLRIGEACALRKSDIDLDRLEMHVAHSVNRGSDDLGPNELCRTKTKKSNRVVPIPEVIVPFIREHISRWCDPDDPMLFQARRADILSPTTVQQQFRAARKAAGRTDITFHTLRATHATMLLICGGTLRECMDELGHTSERIAIQHYQRIVPEHRRQAVERMAERMIA